MKVCVTAAGKDLTARVDNRFGRAPYFLIIDTDNMSFEAVSNSAASSGRGAGIGAAQILTDKDVEALLTGMVGPNAFGALQTAGIKVFEGVSPESSVQEAVEGLNKGEFREVSAPSRGAGCGKGLGGRRDRERWKK